MREGQKRMPRTKGTKNKPDSRFKPYEGRMPKDRHVRLTKDMLDSVVYKSLSASSKVLYAYMKLWACGQDTVKYSASMSSDIMNRRTFWIARDELVEKGFITYLNKHTARDKKATGEYMFCDSWINRADQSM